MPTSKNNTTNTQQTIIQRDQIKNDEKQRILQKYYKYNKNKTNKKKTTKHIYTKLKKTIHTLKTQKRNKKEYKNKMKLNGAIGKRNRKWNNRKIEQQENALQKATDDNNMKPLWDYPNLKKGNSRNTSLYAKDGKETHDTTQTIQRWTQWIQGHFAQTENENQNIQIDHIKEQTWAKWKKN